MNSSNGIAELELDGESNTKLDSKLDTKLDGELGAKLDGELFSNEHDNMYNSLDAILSSGANAGVGAGVMPNGGAGVMPSVGVMPNGGLGAGGGAGANSTPNTAGASSSPTATPTTTVPSASPSTTVPSAAPDTKSNVKPIPKLSTKDLHLHYGEVHALKGIDMEIREKFVTALIGPSGCGKSTYLKTLNRMNDIIPNVKIDGTVRLDGEDIYAKNVDVTILRKKIGMVFQAPNPFPMSIYDNIAYGPRIHGLKNRLALDEIVEESLKAAAIWDEVKDRLKKSALSLSGGQQQRLCIARALATKPEVLLMDEPTSALDPISTSRIEELVGELKKKYSIVIVTHNMQQAARISDYTAFFLLGDLVEYGPTKSLFKNPKEERTENYITGRFG